MKVKKYLSVWAMVCAGALTLAGCSDYDNGYNENAIKFQESFKETFGDIDPEQDWNLAERATVTVNTQTESNIKIYALRGDEFAIVGNYEGVKGTRMLGVDIVEGTRNLIVSDGRTAQKCAPGDVVVFNTMDTRTTFPGNGYVTVSKLTGPVDDLGDGKTYPQYKYKSEADYNEMIQYVPEHGANLNKVTHDFTYISNGSFIIYPYHWETSSYNTIGLYYYDASGERVDVDIYRHKESNVNANGEKEPSELISWEPHDEVEYEVANIQPTNLSDWSINIDGAKLENNTWSGENDASGMKTPFIQYWRSWATNDNNLKNGRISRQQITGLANGTYQVEISVRLFNEGGNDNGTVYNRKDTKPSGVTFYANSKRVDLASKGKTTNYGDYSSVLYKKLDITCTVENGTLDLGFDLDGVTGNWLAWKDLKVTKLKTVYEWESTDGKGSFGHVTCGQGIRVNVPVGTKFGMYLYKSENVDREQNGTQWTENRTYKFFSESALNDPTVVGNGVTVDAEGHMTSVEGLHPCYASTFSVGDQMFLGFEDWPNDSWITKNHNSDFDFNDMVFAFEGVVPTIINEDPETFTWMLACEDLGGTFDRDYNDVVFKVEHVSGQTFAKVTPLAAGGTLASYIFHVPETGSEQCLGEIHQLFGFEPEVSGEYEAHNAGVSRGKEGQTVNITVPEDWSMAYYSTNTFGTGSASYHNMGGFEIRTLPKGTEAPQTTNWTEISTLSSGASRIPAPDMGEAPYIICFPYSYIEYNTPSYGWKTETFWAWPQEFMTIDGCYPDFPGWVSNHSDRTYGTWYQRRKDNAPTVSELKIVTTSGGSPALLPSQLGHDKETIEVVKNSSGYYDVNSYEDLRANLTGADVSGGALHYYYYMHTWNQTEADKQVLNANDHLSNEDPRTIVVVQDADGTYEEGKTSFILKVSAAKTDPDFGTQTSIIQGGNWTNWSTGSGDRTINMTAGEDLWIGGILNGTTGTYVGTLKSFSTGGTNSTCSQWELKPGEYRVYTDPNVGGTMKVVLHYDGNDQYNAKDITITINTTKTVKLVNNGLALSDVNGALQIKTVTDDNQWTNFQKWRIIVAPNDQEFFYLYNVGSGRYLTFATKDDDNNGVKNGDVTWVSDPPTSSQGGKFRFDNGRLITKAKAIDGNKNWITDDNNKRFLGSTNAWVDGTVIWYASLPANAITWTENTLSSAKKRM